VTCVWEIIGYKIVERKFAQSAYSEDIQIHVSWKVVKKYGIQNICKNLKVKLVCQKANPSSDLS
jgi:hypothetical protein